MHPPTAAPRTRPRSTSAPRRRTPAPSRSSSASVATSRRHTDTELRQEHEFIDNGAGGHTTDRPGGPDARNCGRCRSPDPRPRRPRSQPCGALRSPTHGTGSTIGWSRCALECAYGAHTQPVSGTAVGGYMLEQLQALRTDWERNAICNRCPGAGAGAAPPRGPVFSGRAPYGFLPVPEHDTPRRLARGRPYGNWRSPGTDGSAAVVTRIFTCLAAGTVARRIAAELTRSGTRHRTALRDGRGPKSPDPRNRSGR
jgi:hypothetical protein